MQNDIFAKLNFIESSKVHTKIQIKLSKIKSKTFPSPVVFEMYLGRGLHSLAYLHPFHSDMQYILKQIKIYELNV